eukprot:gene1041-3905_t
MASCLESTCFKGNVWSFLDDPMSLFGGSSATTQLISQDSIMFQDTSNKVSAMISRGATERSIKQAACPYYFIATGDIIRLTGYACANIAPFLDAQTSYFYGSLPGLACAAINPCAKIYAFGFHAIMWDYGPSYSGIGSFRSNNFSSNVLLSGLFTGNIGIPDISTITIPGTGVFGLNLDPVGDGYNNGDFAIAVSNTVKDPTITLSGLVIGPLPSPSVELDYIFTYYGPGEFKVQVSLNASLQLSDFLAASPALKNAINPFLSGNGNAVASMYVDQTYVGVHLSLTGSFTIFPAILGGIKLPSSGTIGVLATVKLGLDTTNTGYSASKPVIAGILQALMALLAGKTAHQEWLQLLEADSDARLVIQLVKYKDIMGQPERSQNRFCQARAETRSFWFWAYFSAKPTQLLGSAEAYYLDWIVNPTTSRNANPSRSERPLCRATGARPKRVGTTPSSNASSDGQGLDTAPRNARKRTGKSPSSHPKDVQDPAWTGPLPEAPCTCRPMFHKLDCLLAPSGSVTSAHYLYKAVLDNLFPEHLATLEDYGFGQCELDMDARSKLLGLYIGLMKHLGVTAKTLHSWRTQNEHVLDPLLPGKDGLDFNAIMLAYRFAGGPDKDTSQEAIMKKIGRWSPSKKDCFFMVMFRLGMGTYPGPSEHLWLQFGFCVCRDVLEESNLAFIYTDLLHACSFEEFHTAYCSGSLMPLMESNIHILGIGLQRLPTCILEDLKDVLAGSPKAASSVWSLKQFVVMQAPDEIPRAENDEEVQELRTMYRLYFESPGGEPMKLQEAAVTGQLCECVSSVVDMGKKRKKRMQRLMKNPGPQERLSPGWVLIVPRVAAGGPDEEAKPPTKKTVMLGPLMHNAAS